MMSSVFFLNIYFRPVEATIISLTEIIVQLLTIYRGDIILVTPHCYCIFTENLSGMLHTANEGLRRRGQTAKEDDVQLP